MPLPINFAPAQKYFISTGQLNDYKLDNAAAAAFMSYWIGFSRTGAGSPWTSVDGSITLPSNSLNLFSSPYNRWLPQWFASNMDASTTDHCIAAAGTHLADAPSARPLQGAHIPANGPSHTARVLSPLQARMRSTRPTTTTWATPQISPSCQTPASTTPTARS
jgi:hypothetical protein